MSAEAVALAAALKEPPKPYCYPSLNLFNASRPEDEAGAVKEMKKNADILVNTLDSFGVKTKILDICRNLVGHGLFISCQHHKSVDSSFF